MRSNTKMSTVIMYDCDDWKSNLSVAGVFNNRYKLEVALRKKMDDGDIELDENSPIDLPLKHFSIEDINLYFKYVLLEKIELNELC